MDGNADDKMVEAFFFYTYKKRFSRLKNHPCGVYCHPSKRLQGDAVLTKNFFGCFGSTGGEFGFITEILKHHGWRYDLWRIILDNKSFAI